MLHSTSVADITPPPGRIGSTVPPLLLLLLPPPPPLSLPVAVADVLAVAVAAVAADAPAPPDAPDAAGAAGEAGCGKAPPSSCTHRVTLRAATAVAFLGL